MAVILIVPCGVVGALGLTWALGMTNDIYFQVGLLTTIGLVSKNAILIVEFAKEYMERGFDAVHAAEEAVRARHWFSCQDKALSFQPRICRVSER